MSIIVIGVNHTTAPIDLREKFAFTKTEMATALPLLAERADIEETVILSTCNRTEIYCYGAFEETIWQWLMEHKAIAREGDLKGKSYCYEGLQAVEHLMRVACGIDSMVLGEPEILGQVKAGFTEACLHGTVGPELSRLFRKVFYVAKKVRTSTQVGACPVSVAATTVQLLRQWVDQQKAGCLEDVSILIIGAGDTSRLLAKHMSAISPKRLTIAGRSMQRAAEVANTVGATAVGFDQLQAVLEQATVVVSATASNQPIITVEMTASIVQPTLMIDIAVPRDIEAAVNEHPAISLYCIDDLKQTIDQHLQSRSHAALKAEQMIAEMAREYMLSLREVEASEVIKLYREQVEQVCAVALEEALEKARRGEATEEVLSFLSHTVANKMMHTPCERLRQASVEGRNEVLSFAYELFGIK